MRRIATCLVVILSLAWPAEAENPPDALRQELSSEELSQSWTSVLSKIGVFETAAMQTFGLEVGGYLPNVADEAVMEVERLLIEGDGDRALGLGLGGNLVPRYCYLNEDIWVLRPGRWTVTPKRRWTLRIDETHISDFVAYETAKIARDGHGTIWVDLPSMLKTIFDTGVHTGAWDKASRCLMVSDARGIRARVLFRSPDDEIRYGHPLASITLYGRTGVRSTFCAFHRNRVAHPPFDQELVDRMHQFVKPATTQELPVRAHLAMIPQEHRVAMPLWSVLFLPERAPPKNLDEMSAFFISRAHEFLDPFATKEDRQKRETDIYLSLTTVDDLQNEVIWGPRQAAGIAANDPFLTWKEFERFIGPLMAGAWSSYLLKAFPGDERLSVAQKVIWISRIAELGSPPYLDWIEVTFEQVKDGTLYEAILKSRWRRPCEPRHVEAVRAALAESPRLDETAFRLLDTLVRLGHYSELTAEQQTYWRKKSLIIPGHIAMRWKNLVWVSESREGVAILEQMLDDPAAETSHTDIRRILKARSQAALQLQRFDELPEDLCRKYAEGQ